MCSPFRSAFCTVYFSRYRTLKCSFSGLTIYPGHGMKFVRKDSSAFTFLNHKIKQLFWNTRGQLKASRIAWTVEYRKQHKKSELSPSAATFECLQLREL
jgi:large subunit ribosomal protein L24e